MKQQNNNIYAVQCSICRSWPHVQVEKHIGGKTTVLCPCCGDTIVGYQGEFITIQCWNERHGKKTVSYDCGCQIGDKFWLKMYAKNKHISPNKKPIIEVVVNHIRISKTGIKITVKGEEDSQFIPWSSTHTPSSIGKILFKTRQECEDFYKC